MQIISRVAATQATVDRFLHQEFKWGVSDCAHLAAFHLRQLGYDDPLFGVKPYATFVGARKALKKAGVGSIPAYLDARFERIAPAQAIDGDLVALPADGDDPDWVALGVHVGHERLLAFVPVSTASDAAIQCHWGRALGHCVAAWRTPPASLASPVSPGAV